MGSGYGILMGAADEDSELFTCEYNGATDSWSLTGKNP